jgi:hypothetical protein
MVKPDAKQPRFHGAMTARKSKKITASKPKRTTARRPKRTTARNIELYASAYRIAWNQISPLQKQACDFMLLSGDKLGREQPIPLLIATKALKAVNGGN